MSQEFSAIPTPFAAGTDHKYIVGKSPADTDYLIFEDESVIHSFVRKEDAENIATAYSFLADMRFVLQALGEPEAVLLNSRDTNLAQAEIGGVKILSDAMVLVEHYYGVHEILDGCSDDGLRADIYRVIDQLADIPGVRGSACLLFSTMLNGDSAFEHEQAVGNYLCEFRFGGDAQDLVSLQVRQLNNSYELDRTGRTLMNCLYEVIESPKHAVMIDSMEELGDWIDVTQQMPHLLHALPRLSPDFRGYISEDGPVLRHLAQFKPWMVETDDDGVPVPMRLTRVTDIDPVDEAGQLRDQQELAVAFLMDTLEDHARGRLKSARGELGAAAGMHQAVSQPKNAPASFFTRSQSDTTLGR